LDYKNPTVNPSRANSGNACDSTSSGISYGGNPDSVTEIWDGTSWTSGNALSTNWTGGGYNGSGPSTTGAWLAGGTAPAFTSPADEGWTGTQIYNFGPATVTLGTT